LPNGPHLLQSLGGRGNYQLLVFGLKIKFDGAKMFENSGKTSQKLGANNAE